MKIADDFQDINARLKELRGEASTDDQYKKKSITIVKPPANYPVRCKYCSDVGYLITGGGLRTPCPVCSNQ